MKRWRRWFGVGDGDGVRASLASKRIIRVIARSAVIAFFLALFVVIRIIPGLAQCCYHDIIVIGAEVPNINGTYTYDIRSLGYVKPDYVKDSTADIYWNSHQKKWLIGHSGLAYYEHHADTPTPPATGWIYCSVDPSPLILVGGGRCNDPVFTATGPFSVDENAPNGTPVGDVDAPTMATAGVLI